jgi:hypothetical protein
MFGSVLVYAFPKSNIGGQMLGIYLVRTQSCGLLCYYAMILSTPKPSYTPTLVLMSLVGYSLQMRLKWKHPCRNKDEAALHGARVRRRNLKFANSISGISLGQANTAGYTKKNVQYSILYVGYAAGMFYRFP